jgi:IS1 family transposase/transposase-like protein
MKPRSEKDCPHCQQTLTSEKTRVVLPTPWYQRKGKGGPKKTVPTRHQFCSNPNCDYYLITDENVHALVGYGSHGKYEHIQDLFCQACKKKFTIRRRTILYRLKTHSKTVRLSLALLALGMDISSLEEAIEVRECTLRVWLTRSGDQGRKLHERFFTMQDMAHVQLDELWANVKHAQQDVWLWVVCDAKTKIAPVVQLGPRTQNMAYSVVHELKSRLKPNCVPVFSSDGLKHYFYALTAHFGEWLIPNGSTKPSWLILPDFLYAQVIKHQKRFRLVDVEQRMIWGDPAEYFSRLKTIGLSGNINTAFIERLNLTIRQSVAKLTRRTWGTAQFTPELADHLYWWLAYYHFARSHESLRTKLAEPIARKGKQRPSLYQKMTPAMAAGLTSQHWSVMDLISYPLP